MATVSGQWSGATVREVNKNCHGYETQYHLLHEKFPQKQYCAPPPPAPRIRMNECFSHRQTTMKPYSHDRIAVSALQCATKSATHSRVSIVVVVPLCIRFRWKFRRQTSSMNFAYVSIHCVYVRIANSVLFSANNTPKFCFFLCGFASASMCDFLALVARKEIDTRRRR